MRAWALVGLLVGCGFTPSQERVVDGREPDSGSAQDDQDSDGVPDSIDNCPTVANPDQRDRDHDERGDVCDLCPHIPTSVDTDTDGDGIGDECDPQPNNPNDKVVLWNGFYDASSVAAWTAVTGAWSLHDNAVHQDIADAGDRLFAAPITFDRISVATSFQVVALGTSNATVGFCSGFAQGNQEYCCTIQNRPAAALVATSQSSSGGHQTPVMWPGTFAVGDHIALVQNPATQNRCEGSEGSTHTSVSDNIGATAGKLELYTSSAGAAFEYVFVVELGN